MICCDTCPYTPTCEEEEDFIRDIFGLDDDADVDSMGLAAQDVRSLQRGTCGICEIPHARCSRQDWRPQ